MTKKRFYQSYPGQEYTNVICDVCGLKYPRKDVKKVTDKYNWQYGLVVCKFDLDKTNDQSKPIHAREDGLSRLDLVRPDQSTYTYLVPDNDDRAPSAPKNLTAYPSTFGTNTIELRWDGPQDVGTSGITGYIIQQSIPQLATFFTINTNTGTNATYYNDTATSIDTVCSYKIAAINGAGTGPFSEPFNYPVQTTNLTNTNYLLVSQDSTVLTTGNGDYIVLEY